MKAKSESEVAQSCLTLRDPLDCSLPGPSVHGIFKARVLAWVAIDFSDVSKQIPLNIAYACACSVVSDSVTLWTVAHQAPLSKKFSRQEYWSGLPFPSPGDLPDPGIKPVSPALQADSLPLSHQ